MLLEDLAAWPILKALLLFHLKNTAARWHIAFPSVSLRVHNKNRQTLLIQGEQGQETKTAFAQENEIPVERLPGSHYRDRGWTYHIVKSYLRFQQQAISSTSKQQGVWSRLFPDISKGQRLPSWTTLRRLSINIQTEFPILLLVSVTSIASCLSVMYLKRVLFCCPTPSLGCDRQKLDSPLL